MDRISEEQQQAELAAQIRADSAHMTVEWGWHSGPQGITWQPLYRFPGDQERQDAALAPLREARRKFLERNPGAPTMGTPGCVHVDLRES